MPPSTRSGVHARVRDDGIHDDETVVTDVHSRDTLPPSDPPPNEFDDVHGRETVNRKVSPEFLAYLRSFDSQNPPEVAADPATPQPWTREIRDEQPEIEVGESFLDEGTLVMGPPMVDEPTLVDDRFHRPATLPPAANQPDEDFEIPSFRDGRAIAACVVGLLSVAGAVAAFFVFGS
jgi:hypothetical protein